MRRGAQAEGLVILVVGDLDRWRAAGRELPAGDEVRFVRPAEIDEALIAALAPVLVLSPLREDGTDALDVALLLVAAGYRGPFRAVTRDDRHADLIRDEVADAAPGVDFDLVIVGGRLLN